MLFFLSLLLSCSSLLSLHFEYEGNFSDPADFVSFTGRGAITYAITNNDIRTIRIFTTYLLPHQNTSHLAKLAIVKGDEKGFGRVTKLVSHPYYPDTGNLMFVSADNPDTHEGSSYLYTGKWDSWTLLQRFVPPEEHKYNDFGKVLDVDDSTLSAAVVGCPLCNETKWAGQIYVYSPSPNGVDDTALTHTWSQTQVLQTEYYDFNEHPDQVAFFLGSKVKIAGDVIVGMAQMFPYLSALTFIRNSDTGLWSFQQALRVDNSDVNDFAVYDDTIVLSSVAQSAGGVSEAGAVYIYYPNTNEYFTLSGAESTRDGNHKHSRYGDASPIRSGKDDTMTDIPMDARRYEGQKDSSDGPDLFAEVNQAPKLTHWSQQQVLYGPSASTANNFGSDVSLQKNYLVIGEQGTSTVYLYHRPGALSGKWSQVQFLKPAASSVEFFSRNFFFGSTLVIAGIVDTQTHLETFTSTNDWKCLVVEISDTFGDGWDDVQLQVATPNGGSVDYYAPVCNYPNPFTFRYCPTNPDDDGVYSFSLPDAVLSKYYWEIHYQVYEENTNKWYRGNYATSMSFFFDFSSFAFSLSDSSNLLPDQAACTICPVTSPFPGWAHLSVTMEAPDGQQWYRDDYKGASYSISDAQGRRQLVEGTMCSASGNYTCWHVLLDGSYTFRVLSDLNDVTDATALLWSFCGVSGQGSTHMWFDISDGLCSVLGTYPLTSYCSDRMNSLHTVSLSLRLENTSAVESVNEVSPSDRATLGVSIASLVSFLNAKDIRVESATSSLDSLSPTVTLIDVKITVNALKANFDSRDLASLKSMTGSVVSAIEDAIVEQDTLYNLLKTASAYNTSYFHDLSSISLLSVSDKGPFHVIMPSQPRPLGAEITADGSSFVST